MFLWSGLEPDPNGELLAYLTVGALGVSEGGLTTRPKNSRRSPCVHIVFCALRLHRFHAASKCAYWYAYEFLVGREDAGYDAIRNQKEGAASGIRTPDRWFTKPLLYR